MAIAHPPIDQRTFNDIVQQILGDPTTGLGGLRDYYTPDFKSTSQNRDDPGVVLTLLFGKLMEIVLERLNRIPEKNFVAFLDLLGLDRLPGRWARTPVQFLLPAGNQTGGFVPASTQLVTSPSASGHVYTFETEKGLFLTPRRLQKIFSLVPASDTYMDISFVADGSAAVDIPLNASAPLVEHSLYLAHDTLLGFSEAAALSLSIQVAQPVSFPEHDWRVVWQRVVQDATGTTSWVDMRPDAPSSVARLLESGTMHFDFPGTARSFQGKADQGGGEAHWIRALLTTPLTPALLGSATPARRLPQIAALQFSVTLQHAASFDAAFYNSIPLDLSKDFRPFGEEPQLADTFYLASAAAFSKPGAEITLQITLSLGITVKPADNLLLRWETWNGQQWEEVPVHDGSEKFSVGTSYSPPSGFISFTLPQQLAMYEINGVSNYWLRVRIIQGNYGGPAHFRPKPNTSPQEFELVSPHPPVLSHITLEYQVSHPSVEPQRCFTLNNFVYQDQLPVLQTHTRAFAPFVPLSESEQEPAVYFGFDNTFGDVAISLFFHIKDQPGVTAAETSPQVIWEYSNPARGWSRLEVEDSTNHFTTAGTVSFIGPSDLAQVEHFGANLFWLRARFRAGIVPANRVLQGTFLNTVWAANLATIHDEVLGSGNGQAQQSLVFSQKPVLFAQQPVLSREEVYVKEPEVPSNEARQALEAMEQQQLGRMLTTEERAKLVQVITNPVTQETEIWVRWHQVDSFFGSKAQSRHYILDRIDGVITFGDGQKGMLPPIGRDNIKAFVYQAGGGLLASQEVTPGSITELRSALPFVDKVTNVVAASGGSDSESVDDVLERGPQTIKNRDRAVTSEDFVWLARQASTLVHQVKCLPTRNAALQFEAGAVALLLVPQSEDPQPRPSQELSREVRDYVQARALSILQPKIYIVPPRYTEVRVQAEVVPRIPEEASVVEGRIVNRLNTFLHPIKGGPQAQGWEFGRHVYISEIYQLIEDTPGVDVVLSVVLNEDPLLQEIAIGDNELPAAGRHSITMRTSAS